MQSKRKPTLFIGSSTEGLKVARALHAALGDIAEPETWSEGAFGLSECVLEALVEKAQSFDFAVLVLTPDDLTYKRDCKAGAARDNVLFELGLFMGALGKERAFVIRPHAKVKMHMPSDLAGVTVGKLEERKDANDIKEIRNACVKVADEIRAAIEKAPPRPQSESGLSREDRQQRESKVTNDHRAAVAQGILGAELEDARTILRNEVIKKGRWPESRETQWWQTWLTYRADLVVPMKERYRALRRAFDYVRMLQEGLRAEQREFIDTDEPFFKDTLAAIVAGRRALKALE